MKLEWKEQIQKLIPLKRIPYSNYILLMVVILGLIIRVYKISSLPLYGDELTMVYDSYSLLKTGMDQTGEKLPLTFKMGAGRPAGYVYGSIPFVAVFGPTVWGVRGLSILSSLGIIILMYFLGKKLFSQKVGLLASFLASISLWDIYLARGGFEAHFALFLSLFGVVMFLYQKYIPMSFLWGLAIFTYPTFKLTLPLLFLVLIIIEGFKKVIREKSFLIAILILVIFSAFNLRETFKGVSEERFLRLNVFSDTALAENIVQRINEQRRLSTFPDKVKPLIYNKPFKYTRILFDNYMENLSPSFLYLRGDGNPRHNPGETGMLYLAELPLLLIGLFYLYSNEKRKFALLGSWILIVPLATMMLGQTHALRNSFMIPPFLLISAYAILNIPIKLRALTFVIIGIQLIAVLITLYFYVPNKFGSFWSEAAKIASLKAIEDSKNKEVFLSTRVDNIEYAYPVYAKIEPELVISQYGNFPKVYGNVTIQNE